MSSQKFFMDVTFRTISAHGDKECRTFLFSDELEAMNQIEDYLWDKKVSKVILYRQYQETNGVLTNIPMVELIKS